MILMVEFKAIPSRFRLVTTSRGQLAWADKAARVPLVRSAVAEVPVGTLRTQAIEKIRDRAKIDGWPLRCPFDPKAIEQLARNIAKHIRVEAWVHVEDRGAVVGLGPIPAYACDWMPRGTVLLCPSERRVGMEWCVGDGSSSLAIWGPEQVGVAG